MTKTVLIPAGTLKGRLVDKSGKPVKGAKLQIVASDWRVYSQRDVITDEQGNYTAQDIYPTLYNIAVDQNADITAAALCDVAVKAGETAQAGDMVAVPGVIVSGRVVDAETGKPVSSGWLQASGPMTAGTNHPFRYDVDKQGQFKFRACPGKVHIHFSTNEGPYRFDYPRQDLEVADADVNNIVLKARAADSISGKVVDANGKPVEGAKVGANGQWGSDVTTDASGRFTTLLAPKESWRSDEKEDKVALEATNEESNQGIFVWIEREELLKSKDLVLTLKPAQQVTLEVKDSEGKPLPGAQANMVINYNSMGRYGDAVITDENGQAVFNLYEGGDYHPNVKLDNFYYGDGYKDKLKPGTDEWKDKVEITMVTATRVQKGKVVDESGKPAAGATVGAHSIGKVVRADENGQFVLEGMPDCEVYLDVETGDRYGSARVSKSSGDVTVTVSKH